MKLWQGRFSAQTNQLAEAYLSTLPYESRLAIYDLIGSIAHTKMLAKCQIITNEQAEQIIWGLEQIKSEWQNDNFISHESDEDIHSAHERRLKELIGPLAGKMHTARSRNDQIALDERLYLKDYLKEHIARLKALCASILKMAEANKELIMPGHTHLQIAQPVLFSHWIMAYFWMFIKDYKKAKNLLLSLDECPLGACALAGTGFNIDRFFSAKELGFKKPSPNSIETVSDRDYMIDICYIIACCFMHLSRLCEELIIFNSSQFNFLQMSDEFSTGSSIMPQKKNPDVCEKMRGKCAKAYGNLFSMLSLMKSLPLAYNTDMSEDKASVFESCDIMASSLELIKLVLSSIQLNPQAMQASALLGHSNATDLADFFASCNIPFRQAHEIAATAVQLAISKGVFLQDLSLAEYENLLNKAGCKIDNLAQLYAKIDPKACISARKSFGGTGAIEEQLKLAAEELEQMQA